eukprot:NODE_1297_length_1008_cov_161.686131_g895_i1.p5 GENE.NODE_1297_length_1008_cov_161.686131_g895_i1~~NODE_1297_length_1008_cov_161.686131_g895_i1.p5  ORF type:complete len:120 (-),score=33.85 NODE_1297_length_1008_cov_161.686131_g895_i1:648-962(-)
MREHEMDPTANTWYRCAKGMEGVRQGKGPPIFAAGRRNVYSTHAGGGQRQRQRFTTKWSPRQASGRPPARRPHGGASVIAGTTVQTHKRANPQMNNHKRVHLHE